MNSLFYAINIGTLATWLMLTGFGMVAGMIPFGHNETPKPKQLEVLPVEQELPLGSEEPSGEVPVTEEESTQETSLPAPPEIPPTTEIEPLPEIPEMPVQKPAPSPEAPKKAKTRVASNIKAPSRNTNTGATSKNGSSQAAGNNSEKSSSLRFAAGRMKKPNYPYQARINKQSGTVVVEFTVGTDGRVISAVEVQSSKWPLLDNEALRAVRNWKFPSGGIMKFRKPITFQFK
jgi:TonB family protein